MTRQTVLRPYWCVAFILYWCICSTTPDLLWSQTQTDSLEIISIDEVSIRAMARQAPNLIEPLTNLDESLKAQGFAFQSYGINGSSSAHFRGSSPQHTQVYWNGFNVSSPFLGQTDLSLWPVSQFQTVKLLSPNAANAQGTGSLGAALNLIHQRSRVPGMTQVRTMVSFDQLRNLQSTIAILNNGSKFSYHLNATLKSFKNDFQFRNISLPGKPLMDMDNADLSQVSIDAGVTWHLGNSHFELDYFHGNTDRGIPLQNFQSFVDDRQHDRNHRLVANYFSRFRNGYLDLSLAFFSDLIDFNSDVSTSQQYNSRMKISKRYALKKDWELNGEALLRWNHVIANTRNYETVTIPGRITENFPTAFLGIELMGPFSINNAIRPDSHGNIVRWNQTFGASLLSDLSEAPKPTLKYVLQNGSNEFEINVGKNFRRPTLNEQFWVPGGRLDLLPEQGSALELIQKFELYVKGSLVNAITFELKEYYNRTENWVQWLPQDEGYWSPENVEEVKRMGVQIELSTRIAKGLLLDGNVHFNHSRNSDQERLLYQPEQQYFFKVNFPFGKNELSSQFQSLVKRWDGSDFMDDAFLLDFAFRRSFQLSSKEHRGTMHATLSLKNLLNQEYQITPHRPMPGRYVGVNLYYEFSKRKNE